MALVSLTTLTNGTLADATQVMANYNAITAQVNGHLDGSNLDPALLSLVGASDPSNVRTGSANIPTSETTTGAAGVFNLMATPDRVQGIVLPSAGWIEVFYEATWHESLTGDARAAIFLSNAGTGNQQLKTPGNTNSPVVQSSSTAGVTPVGTNTLLMSCAHGLMSYGAAWAGDVTTGQAMGLLNGQVIAGAFTTSVWGGGPCYIRAAAGAYDVSVRFATNNGSGTITALNRLLLVKAIGF